MPTLSNAHDYRTYARRCLPRGLFEYIDRGTEDEIALRALREHLDSVRLRPSVLTGADTAHLGTSLFGCERRTPLIIAPTALAGIVARDGEIKLARAAAASGIPVCVSTQSITTIEQIRDSAPDAELWFQLYVWRDRQLTTNLLERVEGCGCRCLVVTADTPVAPNREYNQRNGFAVPFVPTLRNMIDVIAHPHWALGVLLPHLLRDGMPAYGHYPPELRGTVMRPTVSDAVRLEPRLTWDDVRRLRDNWSGRLVVKGILSVKDAELAVATGADGIVVSAHGGRNLDCLPTPVECLPAIAQAVGERIVVLADSGIRRGTDVLKYLALGADAVLLGRLPLWGLAAGGERGAFDVMQMISREMTTAMALLGVGSVSAIGSDRLVASQTA